MNLNPLKQFNRILTQRTCAWLRSGQLPSKDGPPGGKRLCTGISDWLCRSIRFTDSSSTMKGFFFSFFSPVCGGRM